MGGGLVGHLKCGDLVVVLRKCRQIRWIPRLFLFLVVVVVVIMMTLECVLCQYPHSCQYLRIRHIYITSCR